MGHTELPTYKLWSSEEFWYTAISDGTHNGVINVIDNAIKKKM